MKPPLTRIGILSRRLARTTILALLTLSLIASTSHASDLPASKTRGTEQTKESTGIASYYADKYHGNFTASGEIFDMHQLTAAHRTLPFGTNVRVTRLDNQKTVDVRINDRGPFIDGRIIDLSLAAARELEMVNKGIVRVKIEIVESESKPALAGATTDRSGAETAAFVSTVQE